MLYHNCNVTMKTLTDEDQGFTGLGATNSGKTGIFLITGASAYAAIALGVWWLAPSFVVGSLIYWGWLAFDHRRRSLNPNFDFDEIEVRSSRLADLRGRVTNELLAGQEAPEVMAFAGNLVGPDGDVEAKYIELRMAQLAGDARHPLGKKKSLEG